ncbi:MAG: class I SAM-dependent methyltransferase, partial [Blastocatellia bacterium]|nr:class I SAM-dependent methyltransferase [Blastocatellia bacterium]
MIENKPSRTAQRVAMRRAAHQTLDNPRVFVDSLALRIAGLEGKENEAAQQQKSPFDSRLRAFLAVRSRCAEDELHLAVERGARQYVVLGAGLDTFAYRNPYPEDVLHVYEVDHPDTQAWKRARLAEAGISIP